MNVKLPCPVASSSQAEAEVKVEPRPAAVSGKVGPRGFEEFASASSWGGSPGGALRAEAAKASGRGPGCGRFRFPRQKDVEVCCFVRRRYGFWQRNLSRDPKHCHS